MDKVPLTSDRSRTTKLGVRLIGLPSNPNRQTLEEWVHELLYDNDLLQYRDGNPVTHFQFIGPDAYIEFRCEEEHRRFLRLRQEYFRGKRIRICNWLDSSSEARSSKNESEVRSRKRKDSLNDSLIHSKKRCAIEKTQPVSDPIREQNKARIEKKLSIRMYCPLSGHFHQTALSMIRDLTTIMRQEGFIQQNEDAVSRYWFKSKGPLVVLEAKSVELACKMCLCSGRRSAPDGIYYRIARERNQHQDPIDWFSYYESRYGRPWKEGLNALRVTFLCRSTLEMTDLSCSDFFLTNAQHGKKKVEQLLCRKARENWQGGRSLDRNMVKAFNVLQWARVGYHFLLEASSNDAASAFASLDHDAIGKGKLILRIHRCYEPCESVQEPANSMQLAITGDGGKGISSHGCEDNGIMRSDGSTHLGSAVPETQETRSIIPPADAKNETDSARVETGEESSVAEISLNDRQQDSKDKEIALLREQLEKVTSALEESEMQTSTIHDDWKTMKRQEQEQEDKLKDKEAQFAQLSESLSLLTRQQLKDRQQIQELTEKLKETNDKLRSSALGV